MSSEGNLIGDLFGLDGKGVIITGATSLMAVWTAKMLHQVGARVVLTDRLAEGAIRETLKGYADEMGDDGLPIDEFLIVDNVDIRNRTKQDVEKKSRPGLRSVFEMVKTAKEHLGTIDVLINIAGGQEPVPAGALSTDILRRTTDRILIGTWNVIHEVFQQSMRDNGGRILTITADVDQGYPAMPAMGAARNGLSSIHRALSIEWVQFGITCCVIAPGSVDTPGLKRYPPSFKVRERATAAANLGRLIEPREIGWLLLTMASPWSASVNGHTLVANGGDSNFSPLFRELSSISMIKGQ